jgi:hypothetical protein
VFGSFCVVIASTKRIQNDHHDVPSNEADFFWGASLHPCPTGSSPAANTGFATHPKKNNSPNNTTSNEKLEAVALSL